MPKTPTGGWLHLWVHNSNLTVFPHTMQRHAVSVAGYQWFAACNHRNTQHGVSNWCNSNIEMMNRIESTATADKPCNAVGYCFGLTSMPIDGYRSDDTSHANTISITAFRYCLRPGLTYAATLCLCIGSNRTRKLNFHESSALRWWVHGMRTRDAINYDITNRIRGIVHQVNNRRGYFRLTSTGLGPKIYFRGIFDFKNIESKWDRALTCCCWLRWIRCSHAFAAGKPKKSVTNEDK